MKIGQTKDIKDLKVLEVSLDYLLEKYRKMSKNEISEILEKNKKLINLLSNQKN